MSFARGINNSSSVAPDFSLTTHNMEYDSTQVLVLLQSSTYLCHLSFFNGAGGGSENEFEPSQNTQIAVKSPLFSKYL